MKRIALHRASMVTVAMEDNDSCGSGVQHRTTTSLTPVQSRQQRQKLEVYNEILRRLKDSGNEEAMQPGFNDQLWAHFNRLPSRFFPRIFPSLIFSHIYTLSSFFSLVRVFFIFLCECLFILLLILCLY